MTTTIPTQELTNFESQDRLFAQIGAVQSSLATVTNLYVAVTGAAWFILIPNTFNLPTTIVMLALALHIVLSVVVFYTLAGLALTISQRLDLAIEIGKAAWPSIEKLGKKVYDKIHKFPWKLFNLRNQKFFWPFVPLVGGLASAVLIWHVFDEQPKKMAECKERFAVLKQAATPHDVTRAEYLIDKGGCDVGKFSARDLLSVGSR